MQTKTAPLTTELEYQIDAHAEPVDVNALDEALAELLLSLVDAPSTPALGPRTKT